MGRSVSTPTGAAAVVIQVAELDRDFLAEIADEHGFDGPDDIPFDMMDDLHSHAQEGVIEGLIETACAAWPSLFVVKDRNGYQGEALNRYGMSGEDVAFLENQHAYIGASEYCGMMALWIISKSEIDGEYMEPGEIALADYWTKQAAEKFRRKFGTHVKAGSMSNGEGVYTPKAA